MILINTNKDCIENIVKFCILICSFFFLCPKKALESSYKAYNSSVNRTLNLRPVR